MKGKAIYNPSGKAGEYSYWACNLYNGCSSDCEYCYCKRGPLSSVWSTTPTLKKTLKDPGTAKMIFMKEVRANLPALQEHGLFFNFTSDPFLKETIDLNHWAMYFCTRNNIPVKALTKQTWWIGKYTLPEGISIGYTLTGMDKMEHGAASNSCRIDALSYFHHNGYKTWASIEPVINISRSLDMIRETSRIVDHYKIGPLSNKKFSKSEVRLFMENVHDILTKETVYWKDGFIEKLGIDRGSLPGNCVSRDFKWWV